jgi:hypothetical protein
VVGDPAVMLCHWPGMYTQGTKQGFEHFKRAVLALQGRFADRTIWMKLSEIARYWAAKELTRIERNGGQFVLTAPFASPRFTLRVAVPGSGPPSLQHEGKPIPLREVGRPVDIQPGTWLRDAQGTTVCFDLPKGRVVLSA